MVPLTLIHAQQNTSLHSKSWINSKAMISPVFPCPSPPCQVRSPLPAAGPTVRRSLPALTSWCATTACTRGTWPSCSLPSEQREEEDDEEEGDNMLCQLVEKDAGTWSAVMVPCQVRTADPSLSQLTSRDSDEPRDLRDAPHLALLLVIQHQNSDWEGAIPQ